MRSTHVRLAARWDRLSPETPLGFLWLAQTVFPGYFDDTGLEQETVDFFKRFYSYDLPQDEYEAFFGQAVPFPRAAPGFAAQRRKPGAVCLFKWNG